MLAGHELRKEAPLLRVGAVAADLVHAKIGMRAVGQADGSRAARDLLHRHAMGDIAEPRAAPLLLHRDAVQAERAEFGPQVARELVGAVDLLGARRDALVGEAAHQVAQLVDIVTEPEIEARPGVGDHGSRSGHEGIQALIAANGGNGQAAERRPRARPERARPVDPDAGPAAVRDRARTWPWAAAPRAPGGDRIRCRVKSARA